MEWKVGESCGGVVDGSGTPENENRLFDVGAVAGGVVVVVVETDILDAGIFRSEDAGRICVGVGGDGELL